MSAPVICVTPRRGSTRDGADDRPAHPARACRGERRVVGMVSIGDLVKFTSKRQSFQIQYLTDYIGAR